MAAPKLRINDVLIKRASGGFVIVYNTNRMNFAVLTDEGDLVAEAPDQKGAEAKLKEANKKAKGFPIAGFAMSDLCLGRATSIAEDRYSSRGYVWFVPSVGGGTRRKMRTAEFATDTPANRVVVEEIRGLWTQRDALYQQTKEKMETLERLDLSDGSK